jgi:myosin heavy subunit
MKKYIWIPLVLLILVLLAGIGFLGYSFFKEREANEAMQELAALDKQEMENEYERFALQYSEMMTQINNDSILAQLTKEQMRTQELLAELKQVKDDDAKEIARLKRELATVRAVLRDYVMQIDSLNRQNQELIAENTRMQGEMDEASRTIEDLSTERETLSERVAMAAQLDAHAITMTPLKKNGKSAKKMKDCKNIAISFNIARNVTAENGQRTVYVRITTPTGEALNGGGTITYENRTFEYSIKKVIEYTGEETPVTMYWNVAEYLGAGSYNVSIFADGNMIGSRNFTFN